MFVLLKKKFAVDISGQEFRRITTSLEQNSINYDIRAKGARGSISTAIDARTYARVNLSRYKGSDTPSVVTMIWVKRKDYQRAFDLCF
jgi:hypothetical protein